MITQIYTVTLPPLGCDYKNVNFILNQLSEQDYYVTFNNSDGWVITYLKTLSDAQIAQAWLANLLLSNKFTLCYDESEIDQRMRESKLFI